jgi:hypothetical protein
MHEAQVCAVGELRATVRRRRGEAELAKACDEKLDSTRRHSGEDRAHDRMIRVCRACCMKACRALGHADLAFGIGMLGWAWDIPTLTAIGFGAGMLHVVNHALFKCALFYA